MLTSDFDFELPAELIAQEAAPRGSSRLLVVAGGGEARHRSVADLPGILRPGDLLVVNNTRVIPARLFARRASGGRVELLLVDKLGPVEWTALLKPGRRAQPGTRLDLDGIEVEVRGKLEDGRHQVRFAEPIEPHLDRLGHVPLPPYINRPDAAADRERYQTAYAAVPGAIAAPTAGLHFTPELLADLRQAGVEIAELSLHVGIGSFKPVTVELVHEHVMEAERFTLPVELHGTPDRLLAPGGIFLRRRRRCDREQREHDAECRQPCVNLSACLLHVDVGWFGFPELFSNWELVILITLSGIGMTTIRECSKGSAHDRFW